MKWRSSMKLLSFALALALAVTAVLPGISSERVQAASSKIWYEAHGRAGEKFNRSAVFLCLK